MEQFTQESTKIIAECKDFFKLSEMKDSETLFKDLVFKNKSTEGAAQERIKWRSQLHMATLKKNQLLS